MSKVRLISAAGLRRRIADIGKRGPARTLHPQLQEALAEARFRLAVHPDTAPGEALDLLEAAARLDGTNPKYAYHLGRLCLRGNALDSASFWLTRAIRLCPTSHRIRAHIGLLQLELNERYRGQADRFEPGALRHRGMAVLASVRRGVDHVDEALLGFVPPPAAGLSETPSGRLDDASEQSERADEAVADRMLDRGSCRWGGVWEIEAEALLVGKATPAKAGQLLELLVRVGRLVTQGRRGGRAAFAILAIQGLVRGYPCVLVTQALHRLEWTIDSFAGESGPAPALLQRVMRLAALGEDELPTQLAVDLALGEVPEFLAATLHQRRILWRDGATVSATEYARACRFLARPAPSEEESGAYREEMLSLEQSVGRVPAMLSPASPKSVSLPAPKKAVDSQLTASDVLHRLGELMARADELQAAAKELFATTKSTLVGAVEGAADPTAVAAAIATVAVVQAAGEAGKKAQSEGFARLTALEDAARGLSAAEASVLRDAGHTAQLAACKKRFGVPPKRLGGPGRTLDKALKKLDPGAVASGTPHEKATEMLARFERLLSGLVPEGDSDAGTAGPSRDESPPEPAEPPRDVTDPRPEPRGPGGPEPPEAGAPLAAAVKAADRALRIWKYRTLSGFDSYGDLDAGSALGLLRQRELMRFAHLLHRLGRSVEARRTWHQVVREDPLCVEASHNVAVSTTTTADPARALDAWRHHLTVLSARAIIEESPDLGASERARLHGQLAAAYGPGTVVDPLVMDPEWVKRLQPDRVVRVLAGEARVREFVDHKLLELLNERMALRSPPLVLGLRRESVQRREAARDTMLAFVKAATASLPGPLEAAFRAVCDARIESAFEACGDSSGLTMKKNPRYAAEQELLQAWLEKVVHLKVKLSRSMQSPLFQRGVTSLAYITQLARFDVVPVRQSTTMLRAAVGVAMAADDQQQELAQLGRVAAQSLLAGVFGEPDPGLSESEREIALQARGRLREALLDGWYRHPTLADHQDLIDAPQPWYPPAVGAAWKAYNASRSEEGGPTREQAELIAAGAQALEAFAERYPCSTEPVRLLVTLRTAAGDPAALEAGIELLRQAESRAITEKAATECAEQRRHCEQALTQLRLGDRLENGTPSEVEPDLLAVIQQQPGDRGLLNALAGLYDRWIREAPTTRGLVRKIERGFQQWAAEADEAGREEATRLTRILTVKAAMAPYGRLDDLASARGAGRALDDVLSRDPGNESARATRMEAHYSAGATLANSGDRAQGLGELRSAFELARTLAREASAPDIRERAAQLEDHLAEVVG